MARKAAPVSRRRASPLDRYPAAVLETIRRRGLLLPGEPVLVALSAGPDSTALLAALAALRERGECGTVQALFVDHGLRAGVEAEAAAALASCDRLGVPLRQVRVVVGAGNVQAEARRARYAALRAEASRVGATRVATGHTRTDQAETVLLRLLRGAGARGLSAIPPRRGAIVRPLIDRSRAEGLDWLGRCGLDWRDDPSNASPRYLRNRLRLELWPRLLELNPALEVALARTADLLRDDERALVARARALLSGASELPVEALRRAPRAVARRVIRRLATGAGGRAAGPEAVHVEQALSLLEGEGDRQVELRAGLVARRSGGRLTVEVSGPRRARGAMPVGRATPPECAIPGPGRHPLPALGVTLVVRAGPGCTVSFPLVARPRRAGDRFRPAGGRGSKTLKAWLIDKKVARARRDGLLLVTDGTDRVLAIPALGALAEGAAGLTIRVEPLP
jgi:tRNA(Ile)-lysidine synthase